MPRYILALLALCAALPAAAGHITEVRALPDRATITSTNQPALVNLTVHVSPGSVLLTPCEVIVDPGDGTRVPRLVFSAKDPATQTAHLRYTQPGTYKVRVSGFGSQGCDGGRDVTVIISKAGASGVAQADTHQASAMPSCPAGWKPATDVSGARLACRAEPVPLACPKGTTYFSQPGVVGCR
jgi:hypothetical protein